MTMGKILWNEGNCVKRGMRKTDSDMNGAYLTQFQVMITIAENLTLAGCNLQITDFFVVQFMLATRTGNVRCIY
jgi:hypothetical protein